MYTAFWSVWTVSSQHLHRVQVGKGVSILQPLETSSRFYYMRKGAKHLGSLTSRQAKRCS